MRRPFRRYAIGLSLRLGMPVNQLLDVMDSADFADYIAFDITQDDEWMTRFKKKQELEAHRALSPEEKSAAFMQAMGAPK